MPPKRVLLPVFLTVPAAWLRVPLAEGEEFLRVHGLVLIADAEVDMAAHDGFNQGAVAGVADGLSQGDVVPGLDT